MKPERFIALEIGAAGIRMGVFARAPSGAAELADHGFAAYEADPPAGMVREAIVATTLKRLLDGRRIGTRKAIVAVEGQAVFSRLAKLPPVPIDKLRQTVRHEAVQHIPFPIDEVVWDAHLADPSASEPEVLLVAVKADLVAGLAGAVEANGLSVAAVDVAPAALANAVRRQAQGEPLLLVELGAQSTNLVFIDGLRTFFRSLPVAGGMLPRLLQEMERSISFYLNQQAGRAPQRILLAGELDALDDPEARIAERLQRPVERFDPLAGMPGGEQVAAADRPRMGVVAGLAMRGAVDGALAIDLVPETLQRERRLRRRLPLLLACAAMAVLLAAAWAAGLFRLAGQVRREAAGVGARIAELEAEEARLVPVERRIEGLLRQVEAYRGAVRQRTFWIEGLDELRTCMPDGMFLLGSEARSEDGRPVGLRITVASYLDKEPEGRDAVILLRDRLRESPRFGGATTVLSRPAKGLFARTFVLDLVFDGPEAER